MSNQHQYFMQDQARGKIRGIMGESWLFGPSGAFWSLLALVSALSVLGGMEAAEASHAVSHTASRMASHLSEAFAYLGGLGR